MVSTQRMSIAFLRYQLKAMYSSITTAMPDTIAENKNTTGISGDDHHGFAFTDPKMKPTYPCNKNADGIPINVTMYPTRSSIASALGLMLSDPSVSTL